MKLVPFQPTITRLGYRHPHYWQLGLPVVLLPLRRVGLNPNACIIILEKAQIERSGCLASGINTINAYITPNQTPESYLEYVKNDSHGLVRDDLVYSIALELNQATARAESWGLPIMKEGGKPLQKGPRSIRIRGESIKPIHATKVKGAQITVLNRVTATNFICNKGRVEGAYGFNLRNGQCYAIRAKGVIIATGGASGLYGPVTQAKLPIACGTVLLIQARDMPSVSVPEQKSPLLRCVLYQHASKILQHH